MEKEKILDSIIIKYEAALKVLETQIEIINNDFKYIKKYNPIEHVKTRMKSYDSIIKKMERRWRNAASSAGYRLGGGA